MSHVHDAAVIDRSQPLLAKYRGVICDLDGVVYRGAQAVPGAIPSLNSMVAGQVPVVFATNNASRTPTAARTHLRELGLTDEGWSVVTSSQAAAAYVAGRLAPGAPVLAVGGPGVADALTEAGLTAVRVAELGSGTSVEAVVQGAGQDVTWRDLAEVAYLAQAGAIWVATNLDATVPTSRGLAPGNGAFVGAVQTTTTAVSPRDRQAGYGVVRARVLTTRVRPVRSHHGRRPAGHRHRRRAIGRSGLAVRAGRGEQPA